MVGNDAHGHIDTLLLTVGEARKFGNFANDGLEDIGVVVGVLALEHTHQAFEAHTGVDDLVGKPFERTVGFAVVLHEDEVPNLDDLWIVLIDERCSGHLGLFFLRAAIDVDFRARAAGTGVAHFPKVVVLVAVDDVVFGEVAFPDGSRFVIALQSGGFVAFEDGDVKVLRVDFQYIHQELIGKGDGIFFEIVAKGPVAEHFKHGVVVGVVSHLFEVVVLTAHAQAFLRVGHATAFGFGMSEDDVLELVHPGVGKHQCRVVLDYHRSRGDDEVSVLLKEALIGFAYFVCCHHIVFLMYLGAKLQFSK